MRNLNISYTVYSMILKSSKNTSRVVLIFFICVAGIFVWFSGTKNDALDSDKARAEAENVKNSLSKHMLLPEGDEPAIHKVTNKVEDPFFNKAEIGDYLVIFYKSRIAYIYSTEKNMIINAGVVFTNIADKNKDGLKLDPKATATTTKN